MPVVCAVGLPAGVRMHDRGCYTEQEEREAKREEERPRQRERESQKREREPETQRVCGGKGGRNTRHVSHGGSPHHTQPRTRSTAAPRIIKTRLAATWRTMILPTLACCTHA